MFRYMREGWNNMAWLIGILIFYFGALFGSFLNVVILRLPKEESLGGRSHCVNCRRELSVLDLFPIFSYLILKGKCRTCGNKISIRYLVIEFIVGLLFLGRWLFSVPGDFLGTMMLLKDWIFIASLVVVFVIDFEHYLILDKVLLGFGLPVLLLNLSIDVYLKNLLDIQSSLVWVGMINGLGFSLIFFIIWFFSKGRWIGFGDVKLMLLLGVALGWPLTFIAWMSSFFIGAAFSVPLLLMKKKSLSSKLPLGCFLSISSLLALFWGSAWFKAYLAILGF